MVTRRLAIDLETVRTGKVGQLQIGGKPRGLSEHHIGRTATGAIGIGKRCPDDQIVEAVAIDVAGRGDRLAALVTRRLAIDLETVRTGKAGQLQIGGKPRGLSEHHIGRAAEGTIGIGAICSNEQIVEAVAIDVASR